MISKVQICLYKRWIQLFRKVFERKNAFPICYSNFPSGNKIFSSFGSKELT
jgi:hypothetical protein